MRARVRRDLTGITLMRYLLASPRTTVWVALLAAVYLAVLPMSGTIALRNLVLALLLVFTYRRLFRGWRKHGLGWPVALWSLYVLLFPLFAQDHTVAWQSLGGQWGRSLLALLAGAGVALTMTGEEQKRRSEIVFLFGVASALPLLIHIFLLGVAYWNTWVIPWGSWGRESHHADLGYAAGHTVILLGAYLACGKRRFRWAAVAFVLLSFLSLLIARSRAGLLFALLAGAATLVTALLSRGAEQRRGAGGWVLMALLSGGLLFAVAYKVDPRWGQSLAQLTSTWNGDALQIECEGGGLAEAPGAPRVHAGDGSRVILMRAGLELALEHPWGLDGSKQAFQKRLQQVCEKPAFLMAHTHNGWLDTVLAIGWIGAALYLLLLLYFLQQGWRQRRLGGSLNLWALVLVTSSLFWMLRGMLDTVYRDHMLEMQGFVLAYAAVALGIAFAADVSVNEKKGQQ